MIELIWEENKDELAEIERQYSLHQQLWNAIESGDFGGVSSKSLLQNPLIRINSSRNKQNLTYLGKICQSGNVSLLREILEREDIEINTWHDPTPLYPRVTSLWIACLHNHTEAAKLLLQDPRIDLRSSCMIERVWVLRIAMQNNLIEIAMMIIKRPDFRASLYCKIDRFSVWHYATQKGMFEIVNLLLDKLDSFELNQLNNLNQSGFFLACACSGDPKTVKLLLQDERIELNRSDKSGQTPFSAACEAGHLEVIKLLLKDKRIQLVHMKYSGPHFYRACMIGNAKVVELLIDDPRIDIHLGDEYNNSPFFIAIYHNRLPVIATFVRYHKVPNLGSLNLQGFSNIKPETMEYLNLYREDKNHFTMECKRMYHDDGDIMALVILLCDDYLEISSLLIEKTKRDLKTLRFLQIMKRLPLQLQMITCKRVYLNKEDYYTPSMITIKLLKILDFYEKRKTKLTN